MLSLRLRGHGQELLHIAISDPKSEQGHAKALQKIGRGSWIPSIRIAIRYEEHGLGRIRSGMLKSET